MWQLSTGMGGRFAPESTLWHTIVLFRRSTNEISEEPMFIGTGTLIKYNDIRAILSAKHVLDKIKQTDDILLGVTTEKERVVFPAQYSEKYYLDISDESKEYPDIGILHILESADRYLRSNKIFYNLNIMKDKVLDDAIDYKYGIFVVIGGSGEKRHVYQDTDHKDLIVNIKVISHSVYLPEHYLKDDYDYFKALAKDKDDIKNDITSYGGFSGGGLWRVDLKNMNGKIIYDEKPQLLGVAYAQDYNNCGDISIHFNGPLTIYKGIIDIFNRKFV